jgi:hypothetical protein
MSFSRKKFLQTGKMTCCSCKRNVYKHVRYTSIMLDIVQWVVRLLVAYMTLRALLCSCLCVICCHSAEGYCVTYLIQAGLMVAQWLRHCATNRKVAESIPDGFIGIFNRYSPSGRTMALGLTQPLT